MESSFADYYHYYTQVCEQHIHLDGMAMNVNMYKHLLISVGIKVLFFEFHAHHACLKQKEAKESSFLSKKIFFSNCSI